MTYSSYQEVHILKAIEIRNILAKVEGLKGIPSITHCPLSVAYAVSGTHPVLCRLYTQRVTWFSTHVRYAGETNEKVFSQTFANPHTHG